MADLLQERNSVGPTVTNMSLPRIDTLISARYIFTGCEVCRFSGKERKCRHAKHTRAGKEASRKAGGRSILETERSRQRTRSPRASPTALALIPKSCWARPMRAASRWRCRWYWATRASSPATSMRPPMSPSRPHDGGFKITKSHIVCEARVPGIDQATFAEHAQAAKAGCPVSQLWLALRSPSRPGSSQIDS